MTALVERAPAFAEHNLFFLALLGLASLARRADRLLEDFGSTPLGLSRLSDGEIGRDTVLCSVLGVLSLRRLLRDVLDTAAAGHVAEAAPSRPAAASATQSCRADLLR
jgi:hypothetical protein